MSDDSLDRFRGLPLDVQALIDDLCSEFEREWNSGGVPHLEEFLSRVAPAHQPALLTELLALEIEFRRVRGEQPTVEMYADRFPTLHSVIREVFQAPAVAPPRPDGLPTIPGYEVTAELGRGGMGVVYRARHLVLNRPVALKMLRPDGLDTLEQRIRFRMEAEAVAALRHPNIVQVYETGEADGRPFLALELVDGGSLDQFTGKLQPRQCAELVEALAQAVQFAHARGIVHRDLKPANILMAGDRRQEAGDSSNKAIGFGLRATTSANGTSVSGLSPVSCLLSPKVTDFGLAQHAADDSRRTQAGVVLGTPAYMAPEQADPDGAPVGPGADVYSLGVILYELLTGKVPHRGRNSLETLELVRTREPVPPRQQNAAVPRDLDTIVLKCLAKKPSRRYATAGALADDLRAFTEGRPVSARPVGPTERLWKWGRRHPALATALVTVAASLVAVGVVSAVAVVRLNRQHDELLAERQRTVRAEQERQTALAESLLTAAPDAVPFILESLAPSAEEVRPTLRKEFESGRDPARRLRAAVGLTVLGDPRTEAVLAAIHTAPATESRNLALALRAVQSPALVELLRARTTAQNIDIRARHAILLLDFGDPQPAAAMLAGGANPTPRTVLIDTFRTWHGDLAQLPNELRTETSPDARSGLCVALGGVAPETLDPAVRRELTAALSELSRDAADAGSHAAAEWALRQWGVPSPDVPRTQKPTAGRNWFVNSSGLTMVQPSTGAYTPGPATVVVLTRPYFVSDREVPASLFRQYETDPTRSVTGKPGPRNARPAPDHPINDVNREEVMHFCNWLSRREGRRECYQRAAGSGVWDCDFAADGYRLPTEAEWDYAQRAGAATAFTFGDGPGWLTSYAHVAARRTAPGGSKRPNRWGLFDMTGNLWEQCWDGFLNPRGGILIDPAQPAGVGPWVSRGGAYDSGAYDTGVEFRHPSLSSSPTVGFRVACGMPGYVPPSAPTDPDGQLRACQFAIEALPGNAVPYRLRTDLLVGKARWAEAVNDQIRVCELEPGSRTDATRCAPLLVLAGDSHGYASYRDRMIRHAAGTRDGLLAERTAKACLLTPVGGAQCVELVRLADIGLNGERPDWARPYAELARGLAAYRAGEFEVAVGWLEKSQAPGEHRLNAHNDATAGFALAMALRRLDRTEDARKAFDRALARVEAEFLGIRTGHVPPEWQDLLIAWVTHREAEELLQR